MAATNTATQPVESSSAAPSADEVAAKAVQKRYEGLVMVRTKAIKGKGAWYWAHLEPILVHNSDTGLPKAVKLRCSLCDALFSASNPSRTASEHLKRGTCPNFNSAPKPISSVSPTSLPGLTSPSSTSHHHPNHRKRSSSGGRGGGASSSSSYQVPPLAIVDPTRFSVELAYPPAVSVATVVTASAGGSGGGCFYGQQQHLMLSEAKLEVAMLQLISLIVSKRICNMGQQPRKDPRAYILLAGEALVVTVVISSLSCGLCVF
ncbi:hypothetical protein TEA_021963 [Camellia sinensis var. sinensis]|uniref:DUF7963 domain-containing protein n=1 Tax=Camellia sinensis var. sinensis TaxID=542762 RepID=A0A4S4ESP8_CAMSN|nr:hypothetical protein TEA_021963 [Camellia sinensis var. sinensis]